MQDDIYRQKLFPYPMQDVTMVMLDKLALKIEFDVQIKFVVKIEIFIFQSTILWFFIFYFQFLRDLDWYELQWLTM